MENPLLEFIRNARSIILHYHTDTLINAFNRNQHLAARGRILGCIRKQIIQYLHHPVFIHADHRSRQLAFQLITDLVLLGIGMIHFQCMFQQRHEFDRTDIELHPARLDLLHIENIVDQQDQPFAVLMRDLDQRFDCCRQLPPHPAGNQRQSTTNRSQRRAQLMTHGGNKFAFHALDFYALGNICGNPEKGVNLAAPITQSRDGQRYRKTTAILADVGPFMGITARIFPGACGEHLKIRPDRLARRGQLLCAAQYFFAVMKQQHGKFTNDFLGTIAKITLCRAIE